MSYNVNAEETNPTSSNFALNFEGSPEQVTVLPNTAFEFATGTIECWLKPATSTANRAFVSMRSNGANSRFSLHINESTNQILIYASAHGVGNVVVTGGIDPNTWYHVAIVMKSSGSDIYVNGVLEGTITQRIDIGQTGKDFVIGSANDPTFSIEAFTGDIDEVRVWNVERTAAEILNNYTNCLEGTEAGLVAYYNFEDGIGSPNLSDLTSNGFDGTLNNIDVSNSYLGNAPITCVSCPLEMSDIVAVTVESPIDTSTTTAGLDLTSSQTGATYQWIDCNDNNNVIAGETNATYTATANGDYAVVVTMNNCSDTSACVAVSTVGVNENELFNQVAIYPNPSNGVVNISLGNLKDVEVKVYSTTGKLIYQQKNINTPKYQFEIKATTGVYFIKLSSKTAVKHFKVIKN